jgi:hypothetical protein
VLKPEERERRERAAAELNARTRVLAAQRRREMEITSSTSASTACIEAYLAGGDPTMDPTRIGAQLALRAIHTDPSVADVLEDLTSRLAGAWSRLRTGPWAPDVLWRWPGLPRVALNHPVGHPLRADMREALPALGEREGWRRARQVIVPGAGWDLPWATLAVVAGHLPQHQVPATESATRPATRPLGQGPAFPVPTRWSRPPARR